LSLKLLSDPENPYDITTVIALAHFDKDSIHMKMIPIIIIIIIIIIAVQSLHEEQQLCC